MYMTDKDGKQVNVAGAGTTAMSIIGTIGAGIIGLNLLNGNCNSGGLLNPNGNNCHNDNKDAVIATLAAEKYSDSGDLALYKQLVLNDKEQTASNNSLFRESFVAIAALDKSAAVNAVTTEKDLELVRSEIRCLAEKTAQGFISMSQVFEAKLDTKVDWSKGIDCHQIFNPGIYCNTDLNSNCSTSSKKAV